ncbi:MAG: hypothetical protein RL326_413, partial [Pseudomonadota bacterium]
DFSDGFYELRGEGGRDGRAHKDLRSCLRILFYLVVRSDVGLERSGDAYGEFSRAAAA